MKILRTLIVEASNPKVLPEVRSGRESRYVNNHALLMLAEQFICQTKTQANRDSNSCAAKQLQVGQTGSS
jgi:hypothetical protein